MSFKTALRAATITLASTLLTGCVTYYQITDTASGKEYITTDFHSAVSGWTGSTMFRDLKTGDTVTLQSYQKKVIDPDTAKMLIGGGHQ